VFEEFDSHSISQASLGGSSYTIELEQRRRGGRGRLSPIRTGQQSAQQWDTKLGLLNVSRSQSSLLHPLLFGRDRDRDRDRERDRDRGDLEDLGLGLDLSAARKKPYPDAVSLIAEQIALPVAASEIESTLAPSTGGGGAAARVRVRASKAKSQLLSARARKAELRALLAQCERSLHRPPWCRVQKRPYAALLQACERALAEVAPRHFAANKEVLQLACELAAHPQTYAAILQVLDGPVRGGSAAGAAGRMGFAGVESDSNEEEGEEGAGGGGGGVGNESERWGEPGGGGDLRFSFSQSHLSRGKGSPFPSFRGLGKGAHLGSKHLSAPSERDEDGYGDEGVPLYSEVEEELLRPPSTPKQVQELAAFKQKIQSLLVAETAPPSQSHHALLDEDLTAYLEQEKNNRRLRDLGYFNKDDFLQFE
jgi:hypothetical protein